MGYDVGQFHNFVIQCNKGVIYDEYFNCLFFLVKV